MGYRKFLYVFYLGLCLVPVISSGQKRFDFDNRCRGAYGQIMMMKVDAGRRLLAEEKQAEPDNLIPAFLDNYIDLFTLFFHENRSEYNDRLADRDKHIALMKQGPESSPYYLFTQAMIYAQWGIIKFKYEQNLSAMWDFRRAYLLIRENNRKFPSFSPDKIILGPMQALIGTIPSSYRWITRILGFTEGSVTRGMDMLHSYVEDTGGPEAVFQSEACFYYAYLKFYILHQPDSVMRFIRDRHLDIRSNALYAFMAANLALNNHETAYGLQVLENMDRGPEYLDMPVLNYEMGTMKLYHLELPDAVHYLKLFVNGFKGKFYVKDALFKLSWACYLQGNMKEAEKYRKLVETRGNDEVDADKVALREASKKGWPDPTILRARMLMNGGFFRQALDTIQQKKIEDYHDLLNKIEYAYFLARIYDELGRDQTAISLYDATIKGGAARPEYYAARAALQVAFIYEKRKDTTRALQYFHRCLQMDEQEYKTTLDQRAKAGINRLTVH
jgi:tetratricopeptide (TPR) repeat protein